MTQMITTQINPQIIQPTPLIEEAELTLLERTMPTDLFRLIVLYAGDPTMPGCDALAKRMIVEDCNMGFKLRLIFTRHSFALPMAQAFNVAEDQHASNINLDGFMNLARFCREAMSEVERNTVDLALFGNDKEKWRAPVHVAQSYVRYGMAFFGLTHDADLWQTFREISEPLRLYHQAEVDAFRGQLWPLSTRQRAPLIRSWLEGHRDYLSEATQLTLRKGLSRFLPEEVEMLSNLAMLDVTFGAEQGKGVVLADLNKCPALRELTLRNCVLSRYNFSSLVGLRDLRLYNCGLKEVPPFIRGLKHLETLDLSANQIEQIPDFLADVPVLQSIYLNGNRIREVPDCLGWFPRRTIELWGNPFTSLPPSLMNKAYVHVDPTVINTDYGCCVIA